jgi:hypothetical protein
MTDAGGEATATAATRTPEPPSWWLSVPVLAPLAVWLEAVRLDRVLAPGDGLTYYLPVQVLAARSWRAGSIPTWDRYSFAGSPLLATGQVGAFYPPNLVHLVLSPAVAHDLLVVLALAVAGLGGGLLGRRLTGDPVAGAVAGLAFGLSGFLFGHLNHLAISATACWLPWAVLGVERLFERRRPIRLLAAGAPVAAAAIAGHPQLLIVVVAVVVLWSAGVGLAERSVRPLLLGISTAGAGLALGAVQLLPVLHHLGQSDRTSLTFAQAMSWSFGPRESLLLVFPHLFGSQGGSGPFTAPYAGEWSLTELSGYVGAAALVLAAAGLAAARHARRLLPLGIIALAGVLVALGDTTPAGRVVHALPVLGQLRSWGRATVALDLAVAVLAAYGVAALRAGDPLVGRPAVAVDVAATGGEVAGEPGVRAPQVAAGSRSARRAPVAVLGVLVVLAAVGLVLPQAPDGSAAWWAVGLPIAAAGAALAATKLPRRLVGAALVLVVGLDMVLSFGWWHRWREQSPTSAQVAAALDPAVPPRWGAVPDAPGGIGRVAFDLDDPLDALPDVPRTTSAKGILTVAGYDPLAPADHLEAVGVDYRGDVGERSRLLAPGSHLADLLRVTMVVGDDLVGRPRAPALPEAFLVGEARAADHATAVAAAQGLADLDPERTALVEGCSTCAAADDPGPAGVAGPVRWGPASASLVVDAERPALLVLSQAWSPGWSATVDGEHVEVVRTDGVVQGVPVPPGPSRVELRHRAPGLREGALLSTATLLALLGLSARSRTTSGRPGRAWSSPPPTTPGTRRRRRRR